MNRILAGVLFVCVVFLFQSTQAGTANISPETLVGGDQPLQSTFRIRAESLRGDAVVTGHGTAFGIDLSEFGFSGPRYLLTACHVVCDHGGSIIPTLRVETHSNDNASWVNVQVLAYDPAMDVALLKSDADLPRCASFVSQDSAMDSRILLVGCPAGIIPTEYDGNLMEWGGTSLSAARVGFFKQGCSGGPVFDRASNKVLGIAVAGVGQNGSATEMDPHTCLFVSHEKVKGFLNGCLPSGKQEALVVDTSFELNPTTLPAESVVIEIPQNMPEALKRLILAQTPNAAPKEELAEYVDVSLELPGKEKAPRAELIEEPAQK